jgi:DNA mismatch repair protein MutH
VGFSGSPIFHIYQSHKVKQKGTFYHMYYILKQNVNWSIEMLLEEGAAALRKFIGIEFGLIFSQDELLIIKKSPGKGIVGQLIEKLIGLPNSPKTLDFDDGEMKTNQSNRDGSPAETMFITQILSQIDHILAKQPFSQTSLFKKSRNMLLVPIYKSKSVPVEKWMILPPIHVDLKDIKWRQLVVDFEEDYLKICDGLNNEILSSPDGFIHTTNGKFIQVRSKDSKPYSPIYSKKYGKYVSNKNHAFYFQKSFMKHLQESSLDYPFY